MSNGILFNCVFPKVQKTITIRSSNISNHFYNFSLISHLSMKSIIMIYNWSFSIVGALMLGGTFAVTNIQKVNAQMGSGNLTGGGMMGYDGWWT